MVQDEKGNTLDGHQRERAEREIGNKNYPIKVIAGLTEEQKWHYAISVNVKRANLTTAQKRDLIEQELKRTPDIANHGWRNSGRGHQNRASNSEATGIETGNSSVGKVAGQGRSQP